MATGPRIAMGQPITSNTSIRFQDPLPEAADVAIIGGGVIGIFAALYLARAGQRVLLCEKGRIAAEQSSRNWGWIRQQGRDAAELPIMMRALELWRQADQHVAGACAFRAGGTVFLSRSDRALEEYENWVALAKLHGLKSEVLTNDQLADMFGNTVAPDWMTAVHTPSDARAEPWQAVPAVAALARQEGALLRENCAVRGLDIEAGRVAGIVTEHGLVRCPQVILAAGAWSSLFARRHGINFPQLTLRGTVLQTAPLPQIFNGAACDEELGFRRREDGGYTLALADQHSYFLGPDGFRHAKTYLPLLRSAWSALDMHPAQPVGFPDGWRTTRKWRHDEQTPFENMRVLEPAPSASHISKACARFAARFPGLGKPKVRHAWAGMIDAMPDLVPIIDRVPQLDGLILATGMSAHGFGIGPGYGEILMKMATSQPTEFDMSRFRFNRFTDGSKLEIGPEL